MTGNRMAYYNLLLTANGFLPGGSGATIRNNKTMRHRQTSNKLSRCSTGKY